MFNDKDFDVLCDDLYSRLDDESKQISDSIKDYESYLEFLAQIHFGYGRWLRNEYNLWDENEPVVEWSLRKFGLNHADDISGIIIAGIIFHDDHELRDKIIDINVERYQKHWEQMDEHS